METVKDKEEMGVYLELYKTYIGGIENISSRRESANKYFITLNSGIFAVVGFLLNSNLGDNLLNLLLITAFIFGLVIAVIFSFLINSYKQLNTGKFVMLHRLEEKFPIQMYKDEWKVLGEGKDKSKYFPFSHVERLIPVVFGLVYLFGVGFVIGKAFC